MKTLILFASRYGATEEIAYMLKSAVGGDVTVRNIRERGITLDGYDTVIIGSCVYMFKLDKHIRHFLRRNEKTLMGKRLGVYLSCYTTPGTEGYLEHFFSPELLAHAAAKDILGGKMQYEKMSYAYKQLFGALMTSPQYRAQYAEPKSSTDEKDYYDGSMPSRSSTSRASTPSPPPCAAERRGRKNHPHPTRMRVIFCFLESQYVVTPVKASSALPVRRTPSSS